MELEVTGTSVNPSAHVNYKNTSVIPASEFNRMKMNATGDRLINSRHDDRKKLKQLSDNRIKNWPNTITALRDKKEVDRFEKFKREELERRKIELEEAEYQSNEKQKLLQKAKMDVFRRHDKVKKLHSTMLMSDVLKERDLQKVIKTHKSNIEKEIEEQHHQNILFQIQEQEAVEAKKQEELERKKKYQQDVLRQQKEEFRERYVQKLREEKLEGEIIKAKALEAQDNARKEENARRRKILEAQNQTNKANEYLKEVIKKEKLKEMEEELKMEEWSKQREERIKQRKEEQDRKFAEKQAIRQRMIDKAVKELAQKKNLEEVRLDRDIEEARVREEKIEEEKREKMIKTKAMIDNHRAIVLKKQEQEKKALKQEDVEFQQFWHEKNKNIEQRIVNDKINRREMNKAVLKYQQKQAADKQIERENELIREMEEAEEIQKAIENDEKMFRTYAEKCVNEWAENGKNVAPILIELKKQRMQNLENL